MISDRKSYQICIIEDNPGDILLIEEYLGELIAFPQLSYARSFREAKALLTGGTIQPDIILLDLTLPDRKGETLILDILAICGQVPVVVLTGHTDIEFSIRTLAFGASDYLLKDDITASSLYKSIIYSIERKKSIAALKESEIRYSNLFQLSPQPMWVYDLETLAFLDVNVAAENHYGYSREDFSSMTIRDLRPIEDITLGDKAVAFIPQQNNFFADSNFRHQKKNGEIILVNVKSNRIDFKGRKAEVILVNDITELVAAQQQLKEAYTNIVSVEEQERERFAAEIHDGIAQNLVAMQLMFPVVSNAIPATVKPTVLNIFSETLDHTILECKEIVNNVRPKDLIDHGLAYMLRQLVQKMSAVGKLNITIEVSEGIDQSMDYTARFHLYRIMQENINNCMKHARALHAAIQIERNGQSLDVSFTDDGMGVSDEVLKAESSFLSLKRRLRVLGGSFCVFTNAQGGLSFQYQIPLVTETAI